MKDTQDSRSDNRCTGHVRQQHGLPISQICSEDNRDLDEIAFASWDPSLDFNF